MGTLEYVVKAQDDKGQRELGTYALRADAEAALRDAARAGRGAGFSTVALWDRVNGSVWSDRVLYTIYL